MTTLLSLFWFIGSCAFAKAVDDIRSQVNVYGDASLLKEQFVTCSQPNTICSSSSLYSPTFASLIISCVSTSPLIKSCIKFILTHLIIKIDLWFWESHFMDW